MVCNILIWTVAVNVTSEAPWPRLVALLDDAEHSRAARFVFEQHRRQYVAAHALKRLMLTAIGGKKPRDWAFETGPGGKPQVSMLPGPRFNLSHCEGLVACAVCADLELGVDVEPVDRMVPFEIVQSHFAAEEQQWISDLPVPERSFGFFRLWTLKEAFLKATGDGIVRPLQDFAFSFDPLAVTFHDPSLGDARPWRFEQRQIGGGHLLALAWRVGTEEASVEVTSVGWETVLSEP